MKKHITAQFQQNMLNTIKQNDIITYVMTKMGPPSKGKVVNVGPEYIEVMDPSSRLLRVFPNQIVDVQHQGISNEAAPTNEALPQITQQQWQEIGRKNGWLP